MQTIDRARADLLRILDAGLDRVSGRAVVRRHLEESGDGRTYHVIGVGKAADSLSKLVFDTVRLSVPQLEILTPEQLTDQVQESFTDEIACIRQEFQGTASGRAYLLLSAASGANLVNALVRQNQQEMQVLSEADREMLVDVGNILINALVGTLANTLDIDFAFGQAICNVMKSTDVHEQLHRCTVGSGQRCRELADIRMTDVYCDIHIQDVRQATDVNCRRRHAWAACVLGIQQGCGVVVVEHDVSKIAKVVA